MRSQLFITDRIQFNANPDAGELWICKLED